MRDWIKFTTADVKLFLGNPKTRAIGLPKLQAQCVNYAKHRLHKELC